MKDPQGLLFVAAMFIGMGIGMIFDMAGAGTIIGMGVGFILMALYQTKNVEHKITFPGDAGRFFLLILGVIFIVIGVCIFACHTINYTYLGAIGIISLGLFFIFLSFK